jgi:DHA3 family macrolide efflux protein-like MFS transporter
MSSVATATLETACSLPAPALSGVEGPRLFNRNFVLLSQAQLVSQFGNQAFTIAITFWTAETTHSATMTGLVLLAGLLPLIVLGPLTGAFIDRQQSPLRIIRACDLLSGACVLLLALGFVMGPAAWRPAMLLATALMIGVCGAFSEPAVQAFVPDLVPRDQIEAANGFYQSARQVTFLTARGLAGVLYALLGPAALFLIDGLSFLFAGATETLIRTRPQAKPHLEIGNPQSAIRTPRSALFGDAADGFRYVAAQPGMIGFMIVAAFFNALSMPLAILLPVFATDYLKADVQWYGFLLGAISAGAFAGCALVGAMRAGLTGSSRRSLMIASFALLAVALGVLGQVQSRWIALAVAFASGALSGMINVLVLSIIQRTTSVEFRGRVLGLHAMMTRALVPIGMVGGGVLADMTGRNVPLVYGICGALALASVAVLAGRRNTRAFLASS